MAKIMKQQCLKPIHLHPPNLSEALNFCKSQKRFFTTNKPTLVLIVLKYQELLH